MAPPLAREMAMRTVCGLEMQRRDVCDSICVENCRALPAMTNMPIDTLRCHGRSDLFSTSSLQRQALLRIIRFRYDFPLV